MKGLFLIVMLAFSVNVSAQRSVDTTSNQL